MAQLIIDSGPVEATDRLREVPQNKWFELMQVRRDFLGVHLPHDCRRLLEFVEDAEQMYEALGFASANDFIQRGLELDPQQVAWALDGLRRMRPDEPIPYERAIQLGRHGGDRGNQHTGGKRQADNISLPTHGTSRAYVLARLDRDGHTELAAKVRADKISANAAAIKAGFRKKPTPFEQVLKLLPKLTDDERRQLKNMLG